MNARKTIKFQWPFRWPIKFIEALPGRIVYELPQTTVFTKCFNSARTFQQNSKGLPAVDWSNWSEVIDEYEKRIIDWYFMPVDENPVVNSSGSFDPAYTLMFSMCPLVDLLSQYSYGIPWHSQKKYKQFLRENFPEFNRQLSNQLVYSTYSEAQGVWRKTLLKDRASVFYVGIRCSLLHHGDLAQFVGMTAIPKRNGNNVLVLEKPQAGQSKCGTLKYDLIIFDPYTFKDKLKRVFQNYCLELKNDPSSQKASYFKSKFEEDYGITV